MVSSSSKQVIILLTLSSAWLAADAFIPINNRNGNHFLQQLLPSTSLTKNAPQLSTRLSASNASDVSAPAPVLDGQRVLPFKIMKAGLKGHKVAAVYALLNSDYKRGGEGWDCVEYVGVSMDLESSLQEHAESLGAAKTSHIRALSFAIPSKTAMDDWATKWRGLADEAGGTAIRPEDYVFSNDDDDDDDDDEWDPEMLAAASSVVSKTDEIVSPFDSDSERTGANGASDDDKELILSIETVDKVLDEVRPYLVADGGNVSVEDVDAEKGAVYLKLEGACGSCPSSTVTMSMGIERVLKENFSDFKEVIQVEDKNASPQELTFEAVEEEFNRLYPAITAMGAVAKIASVDLDFGVVNIEWRGSNKVQQGLELALLDIPFVNRVEFSTAE